MYDILKDTVTTAKIDNNSSFLDILKDTETTAKIITIQLIFLGKQVTGGPDSAWKLNSGTLSVRQESGASKEPLPHYYYSQTMLKV